MTLIDAAGRRKYLTKDERGKFLQAATTFPRETRTFCMTLAATGCRLSEATALTIENIDFALRAINIHCLKKRKTGIYRAVPASPELLEALELVHGIRTAKNRKARLWPWSRRTAGRRVEDVMQAAGIEGPQATAKGLRHCFGVTAIQAGVSLNMVSQWLGHYDLETTAIYANAQGEEEYALASKMWK